MQIGNIFFATIDPEQMAEFVIEGSYYNKIGLCLGVERKLLQWSESGQINEVKRVLLDYFTVKTI